MNDPIKFFDEYYKPLIDSLNSNKAINEVGPFLYHFKLVNELLSSWVGEYKQVNKFIQFVSIVED